MQIMKKCHFGLSIQQSPKPTFDIYETRLCHSLVEVDERTLRFTSRKHVVVIRHSNPVGGHLVPCIGYAISPSLQT